MGLPQFPTGGKAGCAHGRREKAFVGDHCSRARGRRLRPAAMRPVQVAPARAPCSALRPSPSRPGSRLHPHGRAQPFLPAPAPAPRPCAQACPAPDPPRARPGPARPGPRLQAGAAPARPPARSRSRSLPGTRPSGATAPAPSGSEPRARRAPPARVSTHGPAREGGRGARRGTPLPGARDRPRLPGSGGSPGGTGHVGSAPGLCRKEGRSGEPLA